MIKGIIALVLYIATIVAANVALTLYGVIPVDFGLFGLTLMAPAGSFFAGMSFILRDGVQETLGKRYSIAAIIVGAAISAVMSSTQLAIASGVTFLFSEFIDLSVYTPIKKYSFIIACIVSNIIGLFVDTYMFLWLANIPFEYAIGQLVAKVASTVLFIVGYVLYRKLTRNATVTTQ